MRVSRGGRDGWQRLRTSPPVDHLVKAFTRYFANGSDRHAASITYYGFLGLFPLLLLLGSVVGYVVRDDPAKQRRLLARLSDYAPQTLADQLVTLASDHAGTTGLLGLVGLVVAGLGWVDALRESIRSLWHQQAHQGKLVPKKLKDLLVLVGLGIAIALSVVASGLATWLTARTLGLIGLAEEQLLATSVLRVTALGVAVVTDVALLTYLLIWLPRTAHPFRRVLSGALVGAVLIEIGKFAGFYYFDVIIDRGADLYGASLAAAVGLLLWINAMARVLMFAAAWAVTAPYREDVQPSGTAPASGDPGG